MINGGDPLFYRLVRPGSVFFLTVTGKGLSLQTEEGDFSLRASWMAQQVQVNRTLQPHGQIKLSRMLIYTLVVHYLVVHSLPVLAGRGKHARFLSEMEGGIT